VRDRCEEMDLFGSGPVATKLVVPRPSRSLLQLMLVNKQLYGAIFVSSRLAPEPKARRRVAVGSVTESLVAAMVTSPLCKRDMAVERPARQAQSGYQTSAAGLRLLTDRRIDLATTGSGPLAGCEPRS
jgi:hypothetical protein